MSKIRSVLYIFLLLLASTVLLADEQPILQGVDFDSDGGFYMADSAYGRVDPKVAGMTHSHNGGFMYYSGGGYQFTSYFGMEGGSTHYFDAPINGDSRAEDDGVINVAAKGTIPLNNQLNVFAKAGAARVSPGLISGLSYSASAPFDANTQILPYWGTGFGSNITDDVDFNFQFAGTPKSGEIPTTYAATAGLNYKF